MTETGVHLTARETDVIDLLVDEGLTIKAVAERLGLGVSTVKTHVAHAYEKLGIQKRAQLCMWKHQQSAAGGSLDAWCKLQTLSTREREVIQLISQGLSNSGIMLELGITDSSVSTYVQNIYAKLGVHNRATCVGLYNQASSLDVPAAMAAQILAWCKLRDLINTAGSVAIVGAEMVALDEGDGTAAAYVLSRAARIFEQLTGQAAQVNVVPMIVFTTAASEPPGSVVNLSTEVLAALEHPTTP